MIKKLSSRLLLAILLALPVFVVPSIAIAEKMEEISVTAFRAPVSQSGVVGNESIISAETLKLVDPTHLQQVLQRVAGVNLHHNSGQEYLPAIRSPVLSGAGACGSFLMAEDGVSLLPAGFCNVNELFESHYEQAERVDVIRGPSVALYGSNALHGVVNVITPDVGERAQQISAEYGSHDFYRVRVNKNFDNSAVYFTGSSDGGFRDDSGVDQQKLTIRTRKELDDVLITTGTTVTNLNQETAGYISGYKAYKYSELVKSNPDPDAYRDATAMRAWARFSDKSDEPGWVITPYARFSDMKFSMHFLPGTPVEKNGQKSVGVQSGFYRLDGKSSWILGMDTEFADGWLKQFQKYPTEGSVFLQETIPAGDQYDYQVYAFQLGPYLHWNYSFNDHWDVSLGARYEWMRYDYDNKMLDGRTRDDGTECGFGGCRYSRPADRTDNFHNFSPKAVLMYTPAEGHRFHVTYARGFRAPQAVELYRLQRDQQVANLNSERLDSIEFGYRGNSERLVFELLAYAMKKDNMIFRDSDFFNVDSGQTRHMGIELSIDYQLSDELSVIFSGTEARHKYDYDEVLSGVNIDGNDVDSAPRRFGNLVLRWEHNDFSVLEFEWMHMGSYYTDPENEHKYEGHDLFNMLGTLKFSQRIQLSARVTNLFDKAYAYRADYTTFSGDRYFPGPSRSFFAGVTYFW